MPSAKDPIPSTSSRAFARRRPCLRLLLALLAVLVGGCGGEDEPKKPAPRGYDGGGGPLEAQPALEHPPSLVLIVIDTLRADPLDAGGETAGTMPHLAGLAAQGSCFTAAAAPASWTIPSLTSLLTGLLPSEHGCISDAGAPELAGAVTTFAEIMKNAYGYETRAYLGTAWFARLTSVLQGFDHVVPDYVLQGTEALVGPWAKARDREKPFFLLLHTYEAHDPYGAVNHPFPPPPPGSVADHGDPVEALGPNPRTRDLAVLFLTDARTREVFARRRMDAESAAVTRYFWRGLRDDPRPEDVVGPLRKAYYDGLRWVDGNLAETIERLRAWGLLDNALLVVTADHGEAFGEHGILVHSRQLYDELVRVPLVMTGRPPFTGAGRVEGSVGLVDVLPTFFDLAGMEPLTGVEGRSVLGLVPKGGAGHPVISEEWVTPAKTGGEASQVLGSVRSERWKYVLVDDARARTMREEIYDLVADPGERNDLARSTGVVAGLPLDDAFCDAVERVRDRIWGGALYGDPNTPFHPASRPPRAHDTRAPR